LSLVVAVWRRLGVGCRRRRVLLLLGWSRRLDLGWRLRLCGWESMEWRGRCSRCCLLWW
jgi:hypothetical protein